MANEVNLLIPLNRASEQQIPGEAGEGGLKTYVDFAFPIFLGASIALAVVVITWGGLEYILSKVPGAKVEGKERIKSAVFGLVIALIAWIILETINPELNKLGGSLQ